MIFFCGSVYFGQQVQKTMFIFSITISLGTLRFRGTPVEKPWSKAMPLTQRPADVFCAVGTQCL
jgi:hypothetical protein